MKIGIFRKCQRTCFFLFLFIMAAVTWLIIHYQPKLFEGGQDDLSALLLFATSAIALIAWSQFSTSNTIAKNEFYIHISKIWCSKEIIKARMIIHKIFVDEYYRSKQNLNIPDDKKYDYAMMQVSRIIKEMKDSEDDQNFVYLLNLIDIMQSISFFWKKHNFSTEDIYNLYGDRIIFVYEALQDFIKNRQGKNPSDFSLFSELYEVLINESKKPLRGQTLN